MAITKKQLAQSLADAQAIMENVISGKITAEEGQKLLAEKKEAALTTGAGRKMAEAIEITDAKTKAAILAAVGNKEGLYVVEKDKVTLLPMVDSRGRKYGVYYKMTAEQKKDAEAKKLAEAGKDTTAEAEKDTTAEAGKGGADTSKNPAQQDKNQQHRNNKK